MKNCTIATLFWLLISATAVKAEQYQVVFETTSCDGSGGFATVSVSSIYKVQKGDCSDPKDSTQSLQQLLVHDGSGSYSIYSIRQTDAREIMAEVKSYMKARRSTLERANSVIVTD